MEKLEEREGRSAEHIHVHRRNPPDRSGSLDREGFANADSSDATQIDQTHLTEEEEPRRPAAAASRDQEGDSGHVEWHKFKVRAVIEQQQAATRTAIEQTRRQIQEERKLRVEGRLPSRLSEELPLYKEKIIDRSRPLWWFR
jgi:hypothetical protein